jgi:hypothetical protein
MTLLKESSFRQCNSFWGLRFSGGQQIVTLRNVAFARRCPVGTEPFNPQLFVLQRLQSAVERAL